MKQIRTILLLTLLCSIHIAKGQYGMLDTTFGINKGYVIGDFNVVESGKVLVEVQPDSAILVAGYLNSETVIRLKADGSLDSSFGINGIKQFRADPLKPQLAPINFMTLQPDGKIIVGGQLDSLVNGMPQPNIYMVRLNKNGSIDSAFGHNGIVSYPGCVAFAIALQNDGKIITAGGYSNNLIVTRFFDNGIIDNSFGIDGIAKTTFGRIGSFAFSVKVQKDGKIVAAGTAGFIDVDKIDNKIGVVRYNANGTPDSSFGVNGSVVTTIDTFDDLATSVALQQDGGIVVGGYSKNAGGVDFALIRYKSNGSLDSTFDSDGIVLTDIMYHDFGHSLLIQPDDKILLAGFSATSWLRDSTIYPYMFTIARYDSTGALDTNFASKGFVNPFVGVHSYGYSIALQPDGKIVFGGTCFICMPDTNQSITKYAVVRIISGLVIEVGPVDVPITTNTNISGLIYPNPVQAEINIEYELLEDERTSIHIYDLQGRLIRTLLNKEQRTKGINKEKLLIGNDLSSGNYYLKIIAGNKTKAINISKL